MVKLRENYSALRGVNYGIQTDREKLARELGFARRLNLNSVRVWCSPAAWRNNPTGYVQMVKTFVQNCWEEGFTVTPILWNGNMMDPAILDPAYWEQEGDTYTTEMVSAMKNEPGIELWDVMNEPCCNDYLKDLRDPSIPAEHAEQMWAFLRHFCRLVRALDDTHPITIGHTYSHEVEPTVDEVDVISFHDYQDTREKIRDNYRLAMEVSARHGNKPVLNTETGCIARGNPYDLAMQICEEFGCGFYVFENMVDGYWKDIHGIFYPDGTVRDPAIVAAILGFYRKRDPETAIPESPNREGLAEQVVRDIEAELQKIRCVNCFTYRAPEMTPLLDLTERAVNLLEAAQMVPMRIPPSVELTKLRQNPNPEAVRAFAYKMAMTLKEACYIL
jgi:hypothetical protein